MYGLDDIKEVKGRHNTHISMFALMIMADKWELLDINSVSANLHVSGLSETWLNSIWYYLVNCIHCQTNNYIL